jgi:16S rRNA (cytosine967-C5)-methyltransferase
MRGIEAALKVLAETERGIFASESLRHTLRDVEASERKLAASLVYIVLRRMSLWRHLLSKYCKRPANSLSRETSSALVCGAAGVLELEHFKPGVLVSALVEMAKSRTDAPGDAGLINAVLHTVMEEGPSYVAKLRGSNELRDQALAFGVPGWVAAAWSREWGVREAKRLVRRTTEQTFMSLRLSPETDTREWIVANTALGASASSFLPRAVRLESNPYPPDVPGYGDGSVTPQTESSMLAAENLLAHWDGDSLLDMCAGRGVKCGHILSYRKNVRAEAWDLSQPRLKSGEREARRLGVEDRVSFFCRDAESAEPASAPSAILLDAPCSGSGTWGRHPDGKWRTGPESLPKNGDLQRRLLARACDIIAPGGIIMYCVCSLFRAENEEAAGFVTATRDDMIEIPLKARPPFTRKGKPYGTLVFPENPWLDGFYMAVFKKKARRIFIQGE